MYTWSNPESTDRRVLPKKQEMLIPDMVVSKTLRHPSDHPRLRQVRIHRRLVPRSDPPTSSSNLPIALLLAEIPNITCTMHLAMEENTYPKGSCNTHRMEILLGEPGRMDTGHHLVGIILIPQIATTDIRDPSRRTWNEKAIQTTCDLRRIATGERHSDRVRITTIIPTKWEGPRRPEAMRHRFVRHRLIFIRTSCL